MAAIDAPLDLATRMYVGLTDLADALGRPVAELRERETRDSLVVVGQCNAEEFDQRFAPDRIDEWFACFQEDLTLSATFTFPEDGTDRTYSVSTVDPSGWDQMRPELEDYQVGLVTVTGEVAKSNLKRRASELIGTAVSALFFFSTSLENHLTLRGVTTLFNSRVLTHESHSVICIATESGILQGRYVTVWGLRESGRYTDLPPEDMTRMQQAWDRTREFRERNTIWQGTLGKIDPNLFHVQEIHTGLDEVYRRVLFLACTLFMFQFCASVEETAAGDTRAVIAPSSGSVLTIAGGDVPDSPEITTASTVSAARSLYIWAFCREDYDKVDIVRDLMMRQVQAHSDASLQGLLSAAPDILSSARATYRILRHKAFERYLQERDAARDRVSTFVSGARQSIDQLRHDMLVRMLQFFAAVVTYLAVSVFQRALSSPKIPVEFEATGVKLGIVYVLMIMIFQLLPAFLVYRKQRVETEQLVKSYTELTADERESILELLPSGHWAEFTQWLVACMVVYSLGLLALGVLLWHLTR